MAFILNSGKRRITRYPYSDGVALSFRTFEGDERERFEKENAKILNGPKKSYLESLVELEKQVAITLLVDWEGVLDDEGNPVPMTDEAKAAFFDDPESVKYWDAPMTQYLWPRRVDGKKDEPQDEEGGAVSPSFLSSK